jgi:hypothetical protein
MIQCSKCHEFFEEFFYNDDIVISGICKLCFRTITSMIPVTKTEKTFEKILFDYKCILNNTDMQNILDLEFSFYNDRSDEYSKYLLFIINLFLIIIQSLFIFRFLEINMPFIYIHLFILIYTEWILYKIRFKNKFENYYMNIISNYKKYHIFREYFL